MKSSKSYGCEDDKSAKSAKGSKSAKSAKIAKSAKSAKTAGGSADAQTSGSAPVVTQTSTDAASAGTSIPNSLSSSNGEYDSSAVLLVQLLSRLYLLHYF